MREQLQRWRYVCDGHYQDFMPCAVERVVEAADIRDAERQLSREGWRFDQFQWLCGYSMHTEDLL